MTVRIKQKTNIIIIFLPSLINVQVNIRHNAKIKSAPQKSEKIANCQNKKFQRFYGVSDYKVLAQCKPFSLPVDKCFGQWNFWASDEMCARSWFADVHFSDKFYSVESKRQEEKQRTKLVRVWYISRLPYLIICPAHCAKWNVWAVYTTITSTACNVSVLRYIWKWAVSIHLHPYSAPYHFILMQCFVFRSYFCAYSRFIVCSLAPLCILKHPYLSF